MREEAGGKAYIPKFFLFCFGQTSIRNGAFLDFFFLLLETSGILPFSFSDQRMRQEILLSGKNLSKVKGS